MLDEYFNYIIKNYLKHFKFSNVVVTCYKQSMSNFFLMIKLPRYFYKMLIFSF